MKLKYTAMQHDFQSELRMICIPTVRDQHDC